MPQHNMAPATPIAVLDNIALAFEIVFGLRWSGTRTEPRSRSFRKTWLNFFKTKGLTSLDEIGSVHLAEFVQSRLKAGDARGTIKMRLGMLRVVVDAALEAVPPLATRPLPRVRLPKSSPSEKWWLTPDRRTEVVTLVRDDIGDKIVADYIEFVCETGLRVEEALRLADRHFMGLGTPSPLCSVPGTKTAGSQAVIPLSICASEVAVRRIDGALERSPLGTADRRLFPLSYDALKQRWKSYRPRLGLEGVEGATLKALRRSFAGAVHQRGAPTEVLRRLMRHSKISTTAEYLQLIGSLDLEAARKWL